MPLDKKTDNIFIRYWNWRKKRKKIIAERRKAKGFVRDWLETIVSVVIMVVVIRVTVVEAFRIPTGSMEDTLLVGDFLLVNKFFYGIRTPDWVGVPFTNIGFFVPHTRLPGFAKPKAGDIIVFRFPLDPRKNYIKRCVAVAGQTVEVRDKVLYVDGEKFPNPPKMKIDTDFTYPEGLIEPGIYRGYGNRDNFGPVTVPEGQLFMMGDNRDRSADSRYWGLLPQENIVGKAFIIYFSWDKTIPFYRTDRLHRKIRWWRIGGLIR